MVYLKKEHTMQAFLKRKIKFDKNYQNVLLYQDNSTCHKHAIATAKIN